MGFLGGAARAYLMHRMIRGRGRRRNRYGTSRGYGYGRRGRASRGRTGFGSFGPFPTYSRRTRRGSRVGVTGCCLPIPLALTVAAAVTIRQAFRAR